MMNKIQQRYNRIAGVYDYLEWPMEAVFARWRNILTNGITGKVLEIGIGTGKNIPYYPTGTDLIGIDFSERMITKAKKKYGSQNNIKLIEMNAEELLFDDNSFDTVVTSCVFCSVPDPVKGLTEMRRVCKDGGRILMLEHVRSQNYVAGKMMDAVNFIPLYMYGANINRRTYENLLQAGFNPENIKVENIWFDIVKLIRIVNDKDTKRTKNKEIK